LKMFDRPKGGSGPRSLTIHDFGDGDAADLFIRLMALFSFQGNSSLCCAGLFVGFAERTTARSFERHSRCGGAGAPPAGLRRPGRAFGQGPGLERGARGFRLVCTFSSLALRSTPRPDTGFAPLPSSAGTSSLFQPDSHGSDLHWINIDRPPPPPPPPRRAPRNRRVVATSGIQIAFSRPKFDLHFIVGGMTQVNFGGGCRLSNSGR